MSGASTSPIAQQDEARPAIRLLIVDDSAVARAVFERMVSQEPAFEIVGAVPSAGDALDLLATIETPVDVILLDIEMPGRSGIAALPELIEHSGGARVLIVSALADDGAAATVEALTLGAADTLAKPGIGSFGGRFSEVLRDRLFRLGGGAHSPRPGRVPLPVRPAPPPAQTRAGNERLDCVAIGASTGGLHAIAALLRALPPSFTAPILITQHLPASFMPYFADQLRGISHRKAVVAREGMPVRPGQLYIAPGDAHLCVELWDGDPKVRLTHEAVQSGCLPSVDPMFASLALVYGPRVAAVVLSGMGRDGSAGAADLARAGADILVQDMESSVVWGMPGSVAKAGLASAILTPDAIAAALVRRWERS